MFPRAIAQLIFLAKGRVLERGPKRKLLDSPHSVGAREYLEAHKSIPNVGRTEAAVRQARLMQRRGNMFCDPPPPPFGAGNGQRS